MTKQELRKLLYYCQTARKSYIEGSEPNQFFMDELGIKEANAETIHRKMDSLLLEYLNDEEITHFFNSTHKHYI